MPSDVPNLENFAEKNRTKKDGSEGRPYNADLVQSIGAIVEAGLRALWRSPDVKFPDGDGATPWEFGLISRKPRYSSLVQPNLA
jgi:hypothetical protein